MLALVTRSSCLARAQRPESQVAVAIPIAVRIEFFLCGRSFMYYVSSYIDRRRTRPVPRIPSAIMRSRRTDSVQRAAACIDTCSRIDVVRDNFATAIGAVRLLNVPRFFLSRLEDNLHLSCRSILLVLRKRIREILFTPRFHPIVGSGRATRFPKTPRTVCACDPRETLHLCFSAFLLLPSSFPLRRSTKSYVSLTRPN